MLLCGYYLREIKNILDSFQCLSLHQQSLFFVGVLSVCSTPQGIYKKTPKMRDLKWKKCEIPLDHLLSRDI